MLRYRRMWVSIIGLSVIAVLLAHSLLGSGLQVRAYGNPQDGRPDRALVEAYFRAFNAGLLSGNFSGLRAVYAPDATLTQTNSKNVISVAHGSDAIVAWYTKAFGIGTPGHGMQFTPDPRYPPIRSLSPHVVLTYEYGLPPGFSKAGYCMHVFTIQNGWIETVNWVTYFGPVK